MAGLPTPMPSDDVAEAPSHLAAAPRRRVRRRRREEAVDTLAADTTLVLLQQTVDVLSKAAAESARSIESLTDQLAQTRGELEALRHATAPANTRAAAVEEEAADADVFAKPTSLYAFCVDRLRRPLPVRRRLRYAGLLLSLTVAQLILAFAFFDATWWTADVAKLYPAYKDPIEIHNFYTNKTFDIESDGIVQRQPIVNVLASIAAAVLLVSGPLRDDLLQTLLVPPPADALFFSAPNAATERARRARLVTDAILVVPLQVAWALRCFLVPACAAMGTAFALSSADSAVDIVLNSVAVGACAPYCPVSAHIARTSPARTSGLHIAYTLPTHRPSPTLCDYGATPATYTPTRSGAWPLPCALAAHPGFLFELDDVLYTTLITAPERAAYEASPPLSGSCLTVPGATTLAARYAWLIASCDFTFMALAYLKYAFSLSFDLGHWVYGLWQMATFMWIRAAAFAAAGVHFAYCARVHGDRKASSCAAAFDAPPRDPPSGHVKVTGSTAGEEDVEQAVPIKSGGRADCMPTRVSHAAAPPARARVSSSFTTSRTQQESSSAYNSCCKLAREAAQLLFSMGLVFASVAIAFKAVYQPLSHSLSYNTMCIQQGSPFDVCLNAFTKSDACSGSQPLAWTAVADAPLVASYSYVPDAFWSMYDYGPVRSGCVPPRAAAARE